jgi:hypothetical protein
LEERPLFKSTISLTAYLILLNNSWVSIIKKLTQLLHRATSKRTPVDYLIVLFEQPVRVRWLQESWMGYLRPVEELEHLIKVVFSSLSLSIKAGLDCLGHVTRDPPPSSNLRCSIFDVLDEIIIAIAIACILINEYS